MAANSYYKEETVADGVWTELNFGSPMQHLIVVNRGTADIEFSFNGQDIDSKLQASDFQESRDGIDEQYIYIRGVGGSADVEVRAWRGSR